MNLEHLNNKQKEAVLCEDGPLLILAGAGSGKTSVLTTKIAYLIKDKNVNPKNILAITFTNKAAKEMKSRVISLVGSIGYDIQISTFHSFGLRIVTENYESINGKIKIMSDKVGINQETIYDFNIKNIGIGVKIADCQCIILLDKKIML